MTTRHWIVALVLAVVIPVGAAVLLGSSKRNPLVPNVSLQDASARRVDVRFAGCALVRRGPECWLSAERRLTVWFAHAGTAASWFSADGRKLAPTAATPAVGGVRFVLEIPADAKSVRLETSGAVLWHLPLRHREGASWEAAAAEMRRSGNGAGARAVAERVLRAGAPEDRSRAEAMLARIALAAGDRQGAVAKLEQTAREALRSGRISDAASDLFAVGFSEAVHSNRVDAADAALRLAREGSSDDPESRAKYFYYQGVVDSVRGDLWGARAQLSDSLRAAERLGLTSIRRATIVELSHVDAALGQLREAVDVLKREVEEMGQLPACELGPLYSNLSWVAMGAEEQGAPEPLIDRWLQRARELNDQCGSSHARAVDRANLGLRALARGELARGREYARELGQLGAALTPSLRVWLLELEAGLDLAAGDGVGALGRFSRCSAAASALHDLEAVFRCRVGQGRAHERLSQQREALRAYEAAQSALEGAGKSLPAGPPRDGYFGLRDRATANLIAGLHRQGDDARAFAVALHAYQRSLVGVRATSRSQGQRASEGAAHETTAIERYLATRSLIAKESEHDWKLSSSELKLVSDQRAERLSRASAELDAAANDELRTPPVAVSSEMGEGLALLVFPSQEGWFLLSSRGGQAKVSSFAERDLDGAGALSRLVASVGDELRGVSVLNLMPYGASSAADWSATTFAGKPLQDRVDLAFKLGFQASTGATSRPRRALVVADPTRDLPEARRDAERARPLLGFADTEVLQGDAATRDAVMARLAEVDLLYYAGHGEPADLLGTAGIPLADGQRLSPRDVLTLRRVPESVLLAACNSGVSLQAPRGAGWGLAQAFVVRGSRQVIAAIEPVRDSTASALALQVLREATNREDWDLVRALNAAHRQLGGALPDARAAFRVFVP